MKHKFDLKRLQQVESKIRACMISIQGGGFVAKKWCKDNGMQTTFVHNLHDAGLIEAVDKIARRVIWKCLIPLNEITMNDAAKVAELIRSERKPKKEIPVVEEVKEKTLIDFTLVELHDEMERRGVVFNPHLAVIPINAIVSELTGRGYTFNISKLEEYENKV